MGQAVSPGTAPVRKSAISLDLARAASSSSDEEGLDGQERLLSRAEASTSRLGEQGSESGLFTRAWGVVVRWARFRAQLGCSSCLVLQARSAVAFFAGAAAACAELCCGRNLWCTGVGATLLASTCMSANAVFIKMIGEPQHGQPASPRSRRPHATCNGVGSQSSTAFPVPASSCHPRVGEA